jgi:hypothetical protein
MSLNKFTDVNDHKQWMNINCHDIVCDNLTVNNEPAQNKTLYLTSFVAYTALDVTGVKTIINDTATLTATITSLSNGVAGQVIDLFAFYQGSQIVVRHNQSVGGDQPITCNLNTDTTVVSQDILGNIVGYAKLCYSPTAGWICVNTQPQPIVP